MQKRQDLLKVLAFLHFRDFSYSPFFYVLHAGSFESTNEARLFNFVSCLRFYPYPDAVRLSIMDLSMS